ncbi:MAG: hypothetical protein ACR2M5_15015, partial [Nakamurella sp.]
QPGERGQVRGREGSVSHVEVFQVGGVRTTIIGRPRRLSRQRRADLDYTVNCEEPTKLPWTGECHAVLRTRNDHVERPRSVLAAVAPGGVLLVVHHGDVDAAPRRAGAGQRGGAGLGRGEGGRAARRGRGGAGQRGGARLAARRPDRSREWPAAVLVDMS